MSKLLKDKLMCEKSNMKVIFNNQYYVVKANKYISKEFYTKIQYAISNINKGK